MSASFPRCFPTGKLAVILRSIRYAVDSKILKKTHRHDLHQVLAYCSFAPQPNKLAILCYPASEQRKVRFSYRLPLSAPMAAENTILMLGLREGYYGRWQEDEDCYTADFDLTAIYKMDAAPEDYLLWAQGSPLIALYNYTHTDMDALASTPCTIVFPDGE